MRTPDPKDLLELYVTVTDKNTGATLADLAPAGENVILTARTAAALLRGIADDLDPTTRPTARRKPQA